MKNGLIYRITPPEDDVHFWIVSWIKPPSTVILGFEKFESRPDENGGDIGRKEAQDFLQEQRGLI